MSRKLFNVLVNWSIEFGPIGIFFIMLFFMGETPHGFVLATGVFTIGTIVALATAYFREGRLAIFAAVAGAFIVGFGIATVITHNPHVFMFKDTAYNGFFALVLLPGLLKGKGYLKFFFHGLFDLKEEGWFKLSFHYFILFALIATVNEFMWRLYPQEIWIVSKYIATFATIALGFCEIPLGKKYRNPTATAWGVKVTSNSDTVEHAVS
jgi:intracellular septation protein